MPAAFSRTAGRHLQSNSIPPSVRLVERCVRSTAVTRTSVADRFILGRYSRIARIRRRICWRYSVEAIRENHARAHEAFTRQLAGISLRTSRRRASSWSAPTSALYGHLLRRGIGLLWNERRARALSEPRIAAHSRRCMERCEVLALRRPFRGCASIRRSFRRGAVAREDRPSRGASRHNLERRSNQHRRSSVQPIAGSSSRR
jgi:hypothetical protein